VTAADPCFLTVAEAASLIAAKQLSPVELTRAYLDRIERLNGTLHAYVRVLHDQALTAARMATEEISAGHYRGPLHGVPIGLKDIYDTAGVPTEGGSKLCLGRIPASDATTTTLLKKAGAILLGKLTTWEFAIGGTAFDTPFPPARNPWNVERDPAGSSSGSGAAVAAGLCAAAMGSDTGGSIRWPAAWCGLAGLKPSYGRVSRAGIMPLSFSLDHAGPLTWTVEDAAIMLQAVAGHDPRDPASADRPVPDFRAALAAPELRGIRLGVARSMFERDCVASDETRAAFDRSVEVLRGLGASVTEVELPPLALYGAAAYPDCAGRGVRHSREDPARAARGLWGARPRPAYDRRLCPRLGHGAGDAAAPDAGGSHGGGDGRIRRDPAADGARRGAAARRARPLFQQRAPALYAPVQPDRTAGAVGVQRVRSARLAAVVADRRPML
jgi:aspartyl-tRNA(Asn)/glutamyl-tRNA(Gln) amidotransferase subunit A